MIEFDYVALNALAAVAREGSFEGAARRLNVTQSAVSQRIKALEERMGASLIVRGRPCSTTEYGAQLCRHVDHVLLLEHEIKRGLTAENGAKAKAAVLRIVVNNDSLATWFPAVVRRAQLEANTHLELIAEDEAHSLSRLHSGDALAALTATGEKVQGFRSSFLGDMEYVAIASKAFVQNELPDGISREALEHAPSVLFDSKDQLPFKWLTKAFGESRDLNSIKIPSYEGYMACILNGTGWGMMPIATADSLIRSGQLIELNSECRIKVPLFWHSSTQGADVFGALENIVVEEAKKQLIS